DTITEFLIPLQSVLSSLSLSNASNVNGSGIHCGGKENTPALFLNDVEIIQSKGAIIMIPPIARMSVISPSTFLDSFFILMGLLNLTCNQNVYSGGTVML